jgi:heterodisulfide reductase subunit A
LSRDVGLIVVATGATALPGDGLFGYDGNRVIVQLELEERLRSRQPLPESVAMLQCAGARVPGRTYCSRICCLTAVKNAIVIKQRNPGTSLHILYRDLACTGTEGEAWLRLAKELGVRFVHYSAAALPKVHEGKVRVKSEIVGRTLDIPAELLVLSTPLVPRKEADSLSRSLKVPLDENRFFLEAHVKLKPVEFSTDGIYVCGSFTGHAAPKKA